MDTSQSPSKDLFDLQTELEKEMTRLGEQKIETTVNRQRARGDEADAVYSQTILRKLTHKVAEGIEAFIDEANSGKAGRRHASVKVIEQLDPKVVGYLALRSILQCISKDRPLSVTCGKVGGMIEDELRFQDLREQDPKSFARLQRQADKKMGYREKRAAMAVPSRKDGHEWTPWTKHEKLRVGEKLIDIVIQTTGLVEIKEFSKAPKKGHQVTVNHLVPTQETLDWINKRTEIAGMLMPYYEPMVVPPVDWEGPHGGGYLTKYVKPLTLVKTGDREYLRELEDHPMPTVYAALNAMQRTPWQINARVLDALNTAYENGADWTGVITERDMELPVKPHNIAENDEARREWRRAAAKVVEYNRQLMSKRFQFNATRNTANKYADFEAIYFPYQLDFRGRTYAVPNLNPQGPDFMKALLHFSDAKPLGEEGDKWLFIHAANVAGVDKVTFQERYAFIENHLDEIRAIAQDPFSNRTWVSGFAKGSAYEKRPGEGIEIDKPWCFLAVCFEIADLIEWEEQGGVTSEFCSRIPIALDGSCSGLQHYSMALRDPVGAAAVNIMPSDEPQDIYRLVAKEVESLISSDLPASGTDPEPGSDADLAQRWMAFGINRKLVKRSVMTFPYGSGQFGYTEQIKQDTLDPLYKANPDDFPFEGDGHMAAVYLARQIAKALPQVVISAVQGMDYLKKIARAVSKDNLPIRWTTPIGFPVKQSNFDEREKRVETAICGRRIRIHLPEATDKLDSRAQANGISPNFIHSLDAAHLQLTVVDAVDAGIHAFSLIHDSFGTHAGDTEAFFHILRESMVKLYWDRQVFADFREEAGQGVSEDVEAALAEIDAEHSPASGSLDVSAVRESWYAFA